MKQKSKRGDGGDEGDAKGIWEGCLMLYLKTLTKVNIQVNIKENA